MNPTILILNFETQKQNEVVMNNRPMHMDDYNDSGCF